MRRCHLHWHLFFDWDLAGKESEFVELSACVENGNIRCDPNDVGHILVLNIAIGSNSERKVRISLFKMLFVKV
jgi:hypothetical protein